MDTSWYKFVKKINKYDVIIKSIITKSTTSEKMVEIIKKSTKRETKFWGERERERVSIDIFCHEKLGRNRGERWKWSKKKIKMEEEGLK